MVELRGQKSEALAVVCVVTGVCGRASDLYRVYVRYGV